LPLELARDLGEHLAKVALNRYPPADPARFKRRLAEFAGARSGPGADCWGNGSDELIHLMIQACARQDAPGRRRRAGPTPAFVMVEVFARLDGCRFVGVPLQPDFSLDLEALRRAIDAHRPALVVHRVPEQPDRQSVFACRYGSHPGSGARAGRDR